MYDALIKAAAAGCVCVCTMVVADKVSKPRPAVHNTATGAHTAHKRVAKRHRVHHKIRHHAKRRKAVRMKKVCDCTLDTGGGAGLMDLTPITYLGDLPTAPVHLWSELPILGETDEDEQTGGGGGGGSLGSFPGGFAGGGGGFGGGDYIIPTTPVNPNPPIVTVPGTPAPAVPEPATWAMMLFGFGMVGYTMRRQRVRISTNGLSGAQ